MELHQYDSSAVDAAVKRAVSGRAHPRRLYLGPFQSVQSLATIELGPLTFLVGPNSSGKSAVLDALNALANGLSIASSRVRVAEDLVKRSIRCQEDRHDLVMGFGCTSDWHAVDPTIELDSLVDDSSLFEHLIGEAPKEKWHSLDVILKWSESHSSRIPEWMGQYVDGLPFVQVHNEKAYLFAAHPWFRSKAGREYLRANRVVAPRKNTGWIEVVGLADMDIFPLQNLEMSLRLSFLQPNEYQTARSMLVTIPQLLGLDLRAMRSLGPWREVPQDSDLLFEFKTSYGYPVRRGGKSWSGGLAAWERLASAFASDEPADRQLINRVNEWLISSEAFDSGLRVTADVQDVYLRPRQTSSNESVPALQGVRVDLHLEDSCGRKLRPADVGSGISQILPVIVASTATRGIIHIEQPELHLHPRAQATVGDLLLAAIQEPRSLLVETHSEIMLLRVLRRLRERSAGKEKSWLPEMLGTEIVSYYFHPDRKTNTTSVHKVRIGSDGRFLDRWPHGFFAESDDEMFRLIDAEDS